MEELLKQIIGNIFPSEDMKKYLCEHVSELRKWEIMEMIAGAKIPLEKKRSFFERLADLEDTNGCATSEKNNKPEFFWEASYRKYVEKIEQALNDLHIKSKEEGMLLMQERMLQDGEHKILGDLPFFSYEKFDAYLEDYFKYADELSNEEEYRWHMIEKYNEDENGNLVEVCDYIFVNGEVMFYCYEDDSDFDCWPNSDLNLPVPFEPGDIIEVDAKPFSMKKKGVILQIGDNIDCCCVQVLHAKDGSIIDNSALKHSSYIYDNNGWINLSALYTASVYKGILEEKEEYLKIASDFIAGDEKKGYALWDVLMVPVEEFTKEYIENNVQLRKTKIEGGN